MKPLKFNPSVFFQLCFLLCYFFFCVLMLEITLQYIPWDTDVAFLRIKQDYIHLWYYELAFFIHVFSSFWILLAGFTQFSKKIRKKYPKLHQRMGWLYALLILVFAAPSGLVMGIYANGGFESQFAFCLLAVLWFYFTLEAILKIRKGNLSAHQKFMWRSFALTLSAITLRAWKYIIVFTFQPRPMDVYRIVAWLGWVLNLLLIEIYFFYKERQKKNFNLQSQS